MLLILLHIFPGFAASQSESDTIRYISDILVINIKDRLEKSSNVVATVQSDDPVQLIEESGNYMKIETADGKQGWIAKHYLKSEPTKKLLIKQLKQEISDLKNQLTAKSLLPTDSVVGEKTSRTPLCQEIQQKLSDAEKFISLLQEELNTQQHRTPESSPPPSGLAADSNPVSTNQIEQTPENYALLISEYEKRGNLIADLQKTVAKKEDQTRFLWFGAGAAVFLMGMFAGRIGSRKKTKFTY